MRGLGSSVLFPDTPGRAQKRAPPMIVGHLRRISPPLTHDHETAGQAAAGREETPGKKRHSRRKPRARIHDPAQPHRRPWPFNLCNKDLIAKSFRSYSGSSPKHVTITILFARPVELLRDV